MKPLCHVVGACRWAALPIAVLAAATLLGGCASSAAAPTASPATTATPSVNTTAMATPTPSPSRSPSPTPSAIAYGPVSVVTGTAICPSIDLGTGTTDANGVQHARAGTLTCKADTNDPRVTGTFNDTWNADYWGTPDHNNGALVQWGTSRLETSGGAWVGTYTGVWSSDRDDTIDYWYTGTGAYKGLTYFQALTGAGPWTVHGQIYPGTPPKP